MVTDPSQRSDLASEPIPVKQLRVLAPALGGTGLALIGGLGINHIWSLEHAPAYAAGAVLVAIGGIFVAAILISKAYHSTPPNSMVGGSTAAQVRLFFPGQCLGDAVRGSGNPLTALLNGVPKLREVSEESVKRSLTESGADVAGGQSVSPEQVLAARKVIQSRLVPADQLATPGQKDAATFLRNLPSEWEQSIEDARRGTWDQRARFDFKRAIWGLVVACACVVASLLLALRGTAVDAAEQQDEERSAELVAEALPVRAVTGVELTLSDGDAVRLEEAAGRCDELATRVTFSGVAIGGTWQRPVLVVSPAATDLEACPDMRRVNFVPKDPVAMVGR